MSRFFAKLTIPKSCIFFETDKSFAFVNLKPVLPGHVLVSPKRVEPELGNLDDDEVADLMITVKKVNKAVMDVFNGTSSTVTIQNGPEAGQSVPHVHVHVMPRQAGDFEVNDDVYREIEKGLVFF